MSNLATVQPQQHLAAAESVAPFFNEAQEQMILRTFLGGATKEEAVVLLETVRRRRLDPFSRQVYFVKRWDAQKREEVWAIQTSIDGLRSIAERTGKYDGQGEPAYGEDEAGKFCKVAVYRKDWSPGRSAVGIAYEAEFIQRKKDGTVTSFWARMPRLMLAKCAEALAIRKAFPEDTGGLYISEEMGQEKEEPALPKKDHRGAPPIPALTPEVVEQARAAEAERDAPKPAPKPDLPKHVLTMWSRLLEECGKDTAKAQAELSRAATTLWGETVPAKHLWTEADCQQLLKIATDVGY